MFDKLVDMSYTDEDEYEMAKSNTCSPMADLPKFPWGLQLTLTDKEFAKMAEAGDEFDPRDAFVGGEVHGFFMAKIVSVSMEDRESGPTSRVCLQIQALGLESEDKEDREAMKGMKK
jgi:hypothetical protein